jgi:PadR family transcriptional regulator, regulatory protein AphA
MELSKTAYVVLGMLKLGRHTGYEIKALVDKSTRFFWAASYGQIYPELARLEELGLVRGEPDSTDGRKRKVYDLTPAGEKALREWLTSPDPLVVELRHEGALKLFFSDALSPEEQVEQLRQMRAEHESILDQLRAIEPGARAAAEEEGVRSPYRTLEWGIAYEEFLIDWCRKAERRLVVEPVTAGKKN